MKLYVTETSPYCRLVRAFLIEKGIDDRVAIEIVETRIADNPYYAVHPSGRVPYLGLDDGRGFEDSRLIIEYLDATFPPPIVGSSADADFENGRLEALARSLFDGLAVWRRELRRPENERSPGVLAHEVARAARLADRWEREVSHPLLAPSSFNLGALTLAIAVDYAKRTFDFDACDGRPTLAAWMRRMHERPALAKSLPA
jgi:glutathione S-transferase